MCAVSFFGLLIPINTGNGFFMVNSVVALVVLAARGHNMQVITPAPDIEGITKRIIG